MIPYLWNSEKLWYNREVADGQDSLSEIHHSLKEGRSPSDHIHGPPRRVCEVGFSKDILGQIKIFSGAPVQALTLSLLVEIGHFKTSKFINEFEVSLFFWRTASHE